METYGYIYLTTNKISNKRYIGQHKSKDWDTTYYGSGKLILKAIKKYRIENFTCFPLAWAWSKDELNKLEIEYIAHYKPEYNLTKGGEGGSFKRTEEMILKYYKGKNNPFYGKHHTQETINKIIEKNKGNNYHLGHKHTEETKKKCACNVGKHWFTNGDTNVFAYNCFKEGFVKGRTRLKAA
jgi:group I intron endonuclease